MDQLFEDFEAFSMQQAGVIALRSRRSWGAYFKLGRDVRAVFPYINATVREARYGERPEHIRFVFDHVQCTLYPDELVAAPFAGKDEALAYFDRLRAFLNDLYGRREALRPDYRRYQPPSVLDVLQLLPKTNCRGCGHPTCMSFAAALRLGRTRPWDCPHLAEPLCQNLTYPVIDADGRLSATVSIDVRPAQPPDDPAPRPNKPAPAPSGRHVDQGRAVTTPPDCAGLTKREVQVLRLLAEGATNADISGRLHISAHTVKSHVIHIFNKLGVNDRTQAAVWAARHRIV